MSGAVESSLTSPPTGTPEVPGPGAKRRRRLAGVAVTLGALLLTGCQLPNFGAFKGSTSQGRSTFHLWQGFFIAAVIIGAFTFILLFWTLFRYRRRSEDMPRQSQYNTVTEIIYTVVPILVVVGLFVGTVIVENKVTAVESHPYAKINVYAFQWGWEFEYPNGVKVIGQTTAAPTMVMPSNETVRITLRSLDVLHGFYVPEFNYSQYASPGYSVSFDFNVLHNGVFRGQCTQLCGLYHSIMFFNVRAVSPQNYQTWLRLTSAAQRANPALIGQLPSSVHANINGTAPEYGNISSSNNSSGNSGNTGNSGNASNTGAYSNN